MPLVIYGLRDGHTHIHMRPVYAWFKIDELLGKQVYVNGEEVYGC